MVSAAAQRIPRLRRDIQLYPAPNAPDGSPEFTLHDPVSGDYRRIGWAEATVLAHWLPGATIGELARSLAERTTLRASAEELARFASLAEAKGLTAPGETTGPRVRAAHAAGRQGWLMWLIHHYLFIRIPLIHPDAFLTRTLPVARLLASGPMLVLYAAATLAGLLLLAPRWASYIHTFPYFFDLRGAVAYAGLLVLIKLIHEFAHAYVAKGFGLRVRSMGIVLIVFWPIPYSDVTDAWRLPARRPRLWIGGAGVAAELILAGLALLGWAIAPPGLLRSICFIVSSVTVVSTVLVNLNPAMRFDGYYLLSDLWGVDNLRQRAFEMTRWALRRALLGVDPGPPEQVTRRRLAGMMVYSLYSWAYRAMLYLAIALVVYHAFAKVIGVALFAAEIWYFFLRPISAEVRTLMRLRKHLTLNRRVVALAAVLLAGLAWLAAPLERTVLCPAVVAPIRRQVVYIPVDGVLIEVLVARGDRVRKGQVLLEVRSEDLSTRNRVLKHELAELAARRRIAEVDTEQNSLLPEILERTARIRAQLNGVREQLRACTVRAAFDGTLEVWDEALRPGLPVGASAVAGELASSGAVHVVAYVNESDRRDVRPDTAVRFYPAGGGSPLTGRIRLIHPTRAGAIEQRSLTSVAEGEIAVAPKADGTLVPLESYYVVEVTLDPGQPPAPLGIGGRLRLVGGRRSLLVDAARYVGNVILRESNF